MIYILLFIIIKLLMVKILYIDSPTKKKISKFLFFIYFKFMKFDFFIVYIPLIRDNYY